MKVESKGIAEFSNAAVKTMTKDIEYIRSLESKISHLEELLKNSGALDILLTPQAKAEQIIQTEFDRMHKDIVIKNLPMEKEDLKKLDILVKDYVLLRGKPESKKEIDETDKMSEDQLKSFILTIPKN